MIFLSIGSNLSSKFGDRFDNIKNAIKFLAEEKIFIVKESSFYESQSYPNANNPKFINVALEVKYDSSPDSLLEKINYIEKKMERIRSFKKEPRICDIDINDFKKITIKTTKVTLPHAKAHLRNFVLLPLSQICPDWIHPVKNIQIDILIENLPKKSRNEITRLKESAILDA